ncbi:MAG: hypothetical protein CMJ08_01745 [Pelagibacterales bacterium]|nr:hypothetical protein [Pelagibacterales bacterium]|tara:strand:- start:2419 stop:2937 length:519 start_codon:yes stop_codon:yes gene_type:complete
MIKEASDWVKFCVNTINKAPDNKIALDLACGSGRHSIFLSNKGYKVISVDLNFFYLTSFYKYNIFKIRSDIENLNAWPFKDEVFDLIVVTNFLNRLIFKSIKESMKRNGYLIYETFGEGHERFGRPKNKDYLLQKDELLNLTKNMSLIYYEEIKVINFKKKFIKHRILCKNV